MSEQYRVSPFSIVPVEAALDHRLTAMQYRLLIALLSFRNKNSDTVHPGREAVAERCGYSISVVSRVTSQLVELGWLEKEGRGGRSKSTRYRITVPETVTDPKTVTEPVTVSEENGDQPGNGSRPGNGYQPGHENGDRVGHTHGTDQGTDNPSPSRARTREGQLIREPIPDRFEVTERARVMLWRKGLREPSEDEITMFVAHHQSRGTTSTDWDAELLKWCARERMWAQQRQGQGDEAGRPVRRQSGAAALADATEDAWGPSGEQ